MSAASEEDVDMLMAIAGLTSREEAKNLLSVFGDLNAAANAVISGESVGSAPAPVAPAAPAPPVIQVPLET